MSDFDPKRWAEADGGAPEALKSLLEGARADVPSAAELSPVEQALGPLLDVPIPISGGAVTSSGAAALGTGAGSALGYWLAGGAAVVLLGAGAWLLGGAPPSEAPSAPVEAPSVAPLERTSPRLSPKAEPADAPEEMLEASASELPVPLPHASSPALIRPKLAAPQKAPQQSEASLLEQARSLLATNPGRALALTRDHQRRFPNGVLSQEREVIAIDALSRLEREAEAEKRAKSFQERFPDSAHQRKVGDTLPDSSPKTPSKD